MDKLTGKETLDYLNTTYAHFEMTLRPRLMYRASRDEPPRTLQQEKQSAKMMEMMSGFMDKTISELAVKQQRLLYKTDHQELLNACRDAMKDLKARRFSRAKINTSEVAVDANVAEDLKRMPEAIKRLEPVYVWFEPNNVMVALMGGLGHSGVRAYAEGAAPLAAEDEIKLIDGLWYYDDGLREGGPEYRKYLKSLEKEALSPIEWRRKHAAPTPPSQK